MNSTLKLEGLRKIEAIEFLPVERLPRTAESKKSIVDVLCTDERKFQYIVEIQNKYMQNYLQRAQYYISHLYASQLMRNKNYLDLKPVTLLSVLNHSIFPVHIDYLSFHENIEKDTKESYLNDMSYAFIELPKFNKKLNELETIEDYWVFMMKEATHMRDIPKKAPQEIKLAYEILEKHKWTPEEFLAYEKANIALMDELDAMRTAKEEGMKKGMKKGIQKGIQKGRKEGIKEGVEKGIEKGRKEGIKEGMEKGREEGRKEAERVLTQEMALQLLKNQFKIETIMEITRLTQQEIESLLLKNPSIKKLT